MGTQAPAGKSPAASPLGRRGRRPSHADQWAKVTVVLMDRQVEFLDRLTADIRAATGTAIGRAQVIRALIDALSESDLDLTTIGSEADAKRLVAQRLTTGRS